MAQGSWLTAALTGLLIIALVGAATLAGAEVAILRVRRSAVDAAAGSGKRSAIRLRRLLDDLPQVLNTVLLAVLFCQVGAATISGFLANQIFGGVGATLASVLLTALLFLYGEAIPKTIAVRNPERVADAAAPILLVLVRLLRPLVKVLTTLADWQIPRSARGGGDDVVSEAELRMLLRQAVDAGAIEPSDAVIADRSFEFGDRTVAEVMVLRPRIAAVDADQAAVDVMTRAIAAGHRRLPVYEGSIDHMIGAVRLRDLAAAVRTEPGRPVRDMVSEVLWCPPGDSIAHLLGRMQRRGIWMAIVQGTDGRTQGLVTVEDLVAELVGEISDERAVRTPGTPRSRSRGRTSRRRDRKGR